MDFFDKGLWSLLDSKISFAEKPIFLLICFAKIKGGGGLAKSKISLSEQTGWWPLWLLAYLYVIAEVIFNMPKSFLSDKTCFT